MNSNFAIKTSFWIISILHEENVIPTLGAKQAISVVHMTFFFSKTPFYRKCLLFGYPERLHATSEYFDKSDDPDEFAVWTRRSSVSLKLWRMLRKVRQWLETWEIARFKHLGQYSSQNHKEQEVFVISDKKIWGRTSKLRSKILSSKLACQHDMLAVLPANVPAWWARSEVFCEKVSVYYENFQSCMFYQYSYATIIQKTVLSQSRAHIFFQLARKE